jgi:SAM-dependent methyltransferase
VTDIRTVKEVMGNQLLRFGMVRRLIDGLSARPALAPERPGAENIWGNPLHPEQPLRKFRRIREVVGDADCPRGRVIVEIGAGMSLGMGLVALALGPRGAILLDRECYLQDDAATVAAHRELLALLPQWFPEADPAVTDAIRVTGDRVRPAGMRLAYGLATAERLPLRDATVDLTVSHSTLEHLRALEASMRELACITRPGGLGVHQVDLADHLLSDAPLRMLAYSPRRWELSASHRRGWTNRLRLPDYLRAFTDAGFAVEQVEVIRWLPVEDLPAVRAMLHPDFRHLDDEALRALGFLAVVRRR